MHMFFVCCVLWKGAFWFSIFATPDLQGILHNEMICFLHANHDSSNTKKNTLDLSFPGMLKQNFKSTNSSSNFNRLVAACFPYPHFFILCQGQNVAHKIIFPKANSRSLLRKKSPPKNSLKTGSSHHGTFLRRCFPLDFIFFPTKKIFIVPKKRLQDNHPLAEWVTIFSNRKFIWYPSTWYHFFSDLFTLLIPEYDMF